MSVPEAPAMVGWQLLFSCVLLHPTVMMRTAIVQEHGGYATDVPHAEDYDLWARLSAAHRLANLPTPLMSLRRHPMQVSQQFASIQRESADRIRGRAAEALLGERLPDPSVTWWGAAARDEALPTHDAVWTVARLIERLARAYVRRWELDDADARSVRRHAAQRVAALSYLHGDQYRASALLLGAKAAALDPGLIFRTSLGAVFRRMRRRP